LQSQCPALEAIALAQDFAQIRNRQPEHLDSWLERLLKVTYQLLSASPKAKTRRGQSGYVLPWSNGQVEGQINRLKMLNGKCTVVLRLICFPDDLYWRAKRVDCYLNRMFRH